MRAFLLNLAYGYIENNDFVSASDILKDYDAKSYPEQEIVFSKLSRLFVGFSLYVRQGDIDNAAATEMALDKVIAQNKQLTEKKSTQKLIRQIAVTKAEFCLLKGDYESAKKHLNEVDENALNNLYKEKVKAVRKQSEGKS